MKHYLTTLTTLARKALTRVRKAQKVTAGYGSGLYGVAVRALPSAAPATAPPSSPARRRITAAKTTIKKQRAKRTVHRRKKIEQTIENEEWV